MVFPFEVVERIDPKNIGIPNINFTIMTDDKDDRNELYKEQRIERGFDNSELWDLHTTIAKFILPRLQVFKKYTHGYPGCFTTSEEWDEVLDKMIYSFSIIASDDDQYDNEKVEEGLELFAKYFQTLWD